MAEEVTLLYTSRNIQKNAYNGWRVKRYAITAFVKSKKKKNMITDDQISHFGNEICFLFACFFVFPILFRQDIAYNRL